MCMREERESVCVFLCHSLTEKESVYFTMVLLLPNSTASIFRDMSVYRDHKCMPVLKGVVLYKVVRKTGNKSYLAKS